MPVAVVVSLIGALLGAGGLAALVQARSLSRKNDADAQVTLGGGWQTLVVELRTEMNEMRERVTRAEVRADQSEAREAACQERLAKLETHAAPEKIEAKVASLIDAKIAAREESKV